MRRSLWSVAVRIAVVLPALLVVLLATPLPLAATPEGEPASTIPSSWAPTEPALLPGVAIRTARAVASIVAPTSAVGHDRLPTRK